MWPAGGRSIEIFWSGWSAKEDGTGALDQEGATHGGEMSCGGVDLKGDDLVRLEIGAQKKTAAGAELEVLR